MNSPHLIKKKNIRSETEMRVLCLTRSVGVVLSVSAPLGTMNKMVATNRILPKIIVGVLAMTMGSLSVLPKSVESVRQAIVVGAGPAGLSSALVLARRHGYQVTVLEAAERTDVYDPTKAYPFLIRERGQKLTRLFPELQQRLEANGIAVEGPTRMVSVPADPNEILDTEPKPITIFVPAGRNFWIRRHEFIRILLDTVAEEGSITVVNGVECESVAPLDDGRVQVRIVDRTATGIDGTPGISKTLETSLLVACDGMKSKVRQSLAASPSPFAGWENSNPKGFQVRAWQSPASGLQFKTLHINSEAKVPVGDGSMYEIPFGVQTFHTIRSIHKSPKKQVSLGLLPSKAAPTRTLNVIRYDDHEIWQIKDGNELREWFAESFPRFDFSTNSSLVEQAEFDRFARVEGLHLPPCQYSPELYVASPSANGSILLAGDAVHCFPPDLGEGVNSGLEDVVALDRALGGHDKVGDVAREYAKERGPESKALVRMVRFGAPFQYGQFGGVLTAQRLLWTFNFFGRMLLNKITFGLTPRPVFVEVSDAHKKYSTVMRRGDTLTAALWTIVGVVLVRMTGLLPKFGALVA
jgi:kynurenine 3-monooxygenase